MTDSTPCPWPAGDCPHPSACTCQRLAASPSDAGDAVAFLFSTPLRESWVERFADMTDEERRSMYVQAWDIGKEPSYGAKWDYKTGTWKRIK